MISEASCDTDDWRNWCWKFYFASQEFNIYVFQINQINAALVSIRDLIQNLKKILLTQNISNGSVHFIMQFMFFFIL